VLIVIRPGVQINAIEGDALRADGNRRDVRTHVVIEAVLVHAEVSRRVAQANEAWQELRLRILKRHRRPARVRGSDCHGRIVTRCQSWAENPRNVSQRIVRVLAKTHTCARATGCNSPAASIRVSPPKKRRNATVHKLSCSDEARLLLVMTIVRGPPARSALTPSGT
jgi:hypothetical protein